MGDVDEDGEVQSDKVHGGKKDSKVKRDTTAEKQFGCDQCDARFTSKLSVNRHKKSHTSEYKCEFCGKQFSSSYDLKIRHMHIHTNELPIKCHICGDRFKNKKSAKEHICTNVSVPILQCEACSERFISHDEFVEHYKIHVSSKKRKSDTSNDTLIANKQQKQENSAVSTTNMGSQDVTYVTSNAQEQCYVTSDNHANVSCLNVSSSMMPISIPAVGNISEQTAYTVPVANAVYQTGFVTSTQQNYSNIGIPSTTLNLTNMMPISTQPCNVISYEPGTTQNLINPLNVTIGSTDSVSIPIPVVDNNGSIIPVMENTIGISMQVPMVDNSIRINMPVQIVDNVLGVHLQTQMIDNSVGINLPVQMIDNSVNLQAPLVKSTVGINMPIAAMVDSTSSVNIVAPVKSELLSMLMAGNNLGTNFLPCVVSNGSEFTENNMLPTFQDTFAQGKQLYPSSQHLTTFNSINNNPVNVTFDMPVEVPTSVAANVETAPITRISKSLETAKATSTSVETINSPLQTLTTKQPLRRPKKPIKCPLCPKRYHKQQVLDRHMAIHSNPFVCKICGKKFLTEDSLEKKHMIAHKTESNMKNNISNDLDDILMAVSSADFVVEAKQIQEIENKASLNECSTDSILGVKKKSSVDSIDKPSTENTTTDKPFPCMLCKKSYTLQLHLDKHMVIHTNPVICTICGKKFLSKEALETKHMIVHKPELATKNNAITTTSINSQEKLLSCERTVKSEVIKTHLPQSIASEQNMETDSNLSSAISGFQNVIPIPLSNMEDPTSDKHTVSTDLALQTTQVLPANSEVKENNSKSEKIFPCSICKKSYVLQFHLDKHMVLHNNPFLCHVCKKKFVTRLALETHRKRFHPDAIQNHLQNSLDNLTSLAVSETHTYNAVTSDTASLTNINLTRVQHLMTNETTEILPLTTVDTPFMKPTEFSEKDLKEKPYKCSMCTKQYFLKYNLDSHMKIHTNPVICQICGKKFANHYLLDKLHMPVHNVVVKGESESQQTPSTNTVITDVVHENVTTVASSIVMSHIKTEESPSLDLQQNFSLHVPRSDVQNIPVPVSDLATVSNNSETVNIPQLDQTNVRPVDLMTSAPPNELISQALLKDKPYQCSMCNKRYSQNINLTKHMIIHMNPFVCKICGKKFLSKKSLEEKHMPIHKTMSQNGNHENTNLGQNSVENGSVGDPCQVKEVSIGVSVTDALAESKPNVQGPESTSVKLIGCPLCPRKYFSQGKLDNHFLSHTRRYSCAVCGKMFKNKTVLEERHMKLHHPEVDINNRAVAIVTNITDPSNIPHYMETDGRDANTAQKTLTVLSNLPVETAAQPMDMPPQDINTATKTTFSDTQPNNSLDCTVCGKKYNEYRFLKKHMVIHTDAFVCRICGKTFSSRYLLESKHMLTHINNGVTFNPALGIGLFKCTFCRKTYTFKKNLKKHLEGHKVPATCKICRQVCADSEEVLNHLCEHVDDVPVSTDTAGEVLYVNNMKEPPTLQYFAAIVVLSQPQGDHVQLALGQKLAELTLQKLEQEELQENDTSITEEKEPQKGLVWIQCPHCDKRYSQKQYLDRHIVVHTNPFVCKICGKAFSSRYALEAKHMLMHQTETPFECKICFRGFKELRRVREHVTKKHKDVTPFVCKVCGFRFREKQELKEHNHAHKKQLFKCGDCLRCYQSQIALCEHMKRHTGQQNVSCEQCGNMFVYQSTFNKHMLYSDKENKKYVCPPCSESFTDKAQFYVIGLVFERKPLLAKRNNNEKPSEINQTNVNIKTEGGLSSDLLSVSSIVQSDTEIQIAVNEGKDWSAASENIVFGINSSQTTNQSNKCSSSYEEVRNCSLPNQHIVLGKSSDCPVSNDNVQNHTDNFLESKENIALDNNMLNHSIDSSTTSSSNENVVLEKSVDGSDSSKNTVLNQNNDINYPNETTVFHQFGNLSSNSEHIELSVNSRSVSVENDNQMINVTPLSLTLQHKEEQTKCEEIASNLTPVSSAISESVSPVHNDVEQLNTLKCALSKPDVFKDVPESKPTSSNNINHFVVPKDFKTFTDIMIDQSIHTEDDVTTELK